MQENIIPMDQRRSKTSGTKHWILVAAVLVLVTASILSLEFYSSQKVRRFALSSGPVTNAVPTEKTMLQGSPLSNTLSQEALDAIVSNQSRRGVYDMPLRLAEFKAKLALTDDEHNRLLSDVVDFERRRTQFEQSLVTVDSFDESHLLLAIPPYPEQGLELKAELKEQIRLDFSPDRAELINGAVDSHMEELFRGFGKFSQTMNVSIPDGDGGVVRVVFAAGLSTPLESADDETLAELERLTGNGAYSRDGLKLYWEGISNTVNAYFPAMSSNANSSTGTRKGAGP